MNQISISKIADEMLFKFTIIVSSCTIASAVQNLQN